MRCIPSRLSWRHGRVVLSLEQLESRTLLAGDLDLSVTEAAPAEPDASHRVALVLKLTSPDGAPLESVRVGDEFVVRVYSEDLRATPRGVFAAYADVTWDAALAEVVGPASYGPAYPNGSRTDLSLETPGLIDEAGAFAGFSELRGGLHEVFSVPLRALAAGDLVFAADPADNLPLHRVLVYDDAGADPIVQESEVRYGQVAVTVAPAEAAAPEEPLAEEVAPDAAMSPPVADDPVAEQPLADPADSTAATTSVTEDALSAGAVAAVCYPPEGADPSPAPSESSEVTSSTASPATSSDGSADAAGAVLTAADLAGLLSASMSSSEDGEDSDDDPLALWPSEAQPV
jgi:hypothetical protein